MRQILIRTGWIVAIGMAIFAPAPGLQAGDPDRPAGRVTRYDIATQKDLLLSHQVAPEMVGDVEQWSKRLLDALPGQIGDWVTQFIDATKIATVITEAFPVEGQPALTVCSIILMQRRWPVDEDSGRGPYASHRPAAGASDRSC